MSIYEVYFEDTLKVQNNGNTLHSMVHVCIYTHTHADINIYIYINVYIYIYIVKRVIILKWSYLMLLIYNVN